MELQIRGVSKTYANGVQALKNVTLTIVGADVAAFAVTFGRGISLAVCCCCAGPSCCSLD